MKLKDIDKAVIFWGILNREVLNSLERKELIGVCEGRPYLYGLGNMKFLREKGFRFFYLTDNMLGSLFFENKVKSTFIFYRRKLKNKFFCPSGSLYVYLLSKLHKVEVKFFPQGKPLSFLDKDASSLGGRSFVLEEDKGFVEEPLEEVIDV